MAQQVLALAAQWIGLAFVEMHACQRPTAQQLQCGAAVAFAHGMRQRCQVQRIALPVTTLQLHATAGEGARRGLRLQRGRCQQTLQCLRIMGAGADAITAGAQDRAEHITGFDRGQLIGVAKQDQAGAAGDRVDQLGHHRQIDH